MKDAPPTGPWPRRLGLLSGATAGLLVAFAVAWAAEKAHAGNPEWILRLGSPVGILGGAAIGTRLTRNIGAQGYRILASATGLFVAGVLALLLLALFGISK